MKADKNRDNFQTLVFCSNTLTNYQKIIDTAENYEPVIIEKGSPPRITLVARTGQNESIVILHRNTARAREVSVSIVENHIRVFVLDKLVISAVTVAEDHAVVDDLNLEPLGLRITGDSTALRFGGSTLSGSRFDGVGNMLFLG